MTKEKIVVAIYARVSSDKQREERTIESQLDELPKYAKKCGYKVAETYVDDGISGTTIQDRPAFSQLLDDCTKGLFQAILVIEHNRITRSDNPEEVGKISRIFMENDIKIISPAEGILDLKHPPDELVAWIKTWIAKEERQELRRKLARGKRYKLEKGYWLGPAPFGYAFDKKTKTWSFVEEEKRLIEWMHHKFLVDGWSLRMICDDLHRRGVKGRRKVFSHNSLCYLFHSEAYTGTTFANRYNKQIGERPREEWIAFKIPRLITQRTYKKILNRLAELKTTGRPSVKGRYLFQGMLRCGLCGSRMRVHKNQHHLYYACHNRSEAREYARTTPDKKRCKLPFVRADKFDKGLFEFIIQQLADPTILKREIARANFSPGRVEQLEKKRKKLEQEDAKIAKKIERLMENMEEGLLDLFHKRIWQRKAERARIAEDIEEIERQLGTAREGDERMEEIARKVDEIGHILWSRIFEEMVGLGPEYQRKVVEALFVSLPERIEVKPSKFKSSPLGSGVTAGWKPHLSFDLVSSVAQKAKLGENMKDAFDHSFIEREESAKEVVKKGRKGKKAIENPPGPFQPPELPYPDSRYCQSRD